MPPEDLIVLLFSKLLLSKEAHLLAIFLGAEFLVVGFILLRRNDRKRCYNGIDTVNEWHHYCCCWYFFLA